MRRASPVDEVSTFWTHQHGLAQVISVPILLEGEPPDILGRLTVGFFLDAALATQLKRLTGSEIAFAAGGRVLASSLPDAGPAALDEIVAQRQVTRATIGGEEFLGIARPLPAAGAATAVADAPIAIVLRSRTERLRFLTTIRTGLIGALIVTLVLATLVSYGVARTVARPLSAITGAMREVAATGDLTRKVTLRSGRWDDEDARLLASTFNTLTDSIARSQAESAQKDRLSSLGRLSTVIAHEIRNPLMIIKASLYGLRDEAAAAERHEAVKDIEDETRRINRIVADVLDFAKPLQFDLHETDLNEICRVSATAACAGSSTSEPGEGSAAIVLDLDDSIPPTLTDGERLRMALVNLLTNARHAVELPASTGGDHLPAKAGSHNGAETWLPPSGGRISLTTRRLGDRARIVVADRGVGIAPDDMAHIFDPYFTTRRAGTGLGLPIARNIIEGLHGTIAVSSRVGEGTEISIELPIVPPEARA